MSEGRSAYARAVDDWYVERLLDAELRLDLAQFKLRFDLAGPFPATRGALQRAKIAGAALARAVASLSGSAGLDGAAFGLLIEPAPKSSAAGPESFVLRLGKRLALHKWMEAFAELAPEIAELEAGASAWAGANGRNVASTLNGSNERIRARMVAPDGKSAKTLESAR